MDQKKEELGCLNFAFVCENNCDKKKEYSDTIDRSASFSRNIDCDHYSLKMVRKRRQNKITLHLTFECQKCQKEENKMFEDVLEGNFEFQCCGQKKALCYFIISFTFIYLKIRLYKILKEENDNNLIDNDTNKNIINSVNSKISISENDIEKEIIKQSEYYNYFHVYPWPNISEENQITLIFKYYKRIENNYYFHCSKENYLSELLKKFKEESDINDNIRFAVSNAKRLEGEKTIKELGLKNMSYILVR